MTFIATAEPGDDEMAARIERHRAERPAGWQTVEAPLDLGASLAHIDADHFLVIDCLTLWLSNLMGAGRTTSEARAQAHAVAGLISSRPGAVVSNEVGLGIVPANALAREYRDLLGEVNAIFAAAAERTFLMVAGRALELTPLEMPART